MGKLTLAWGEYGESKSLARFRSTGGRVPPSSESHSRYKCKAHWCRGGSTSPRCGEISYKGEV